MPRRETTARWYRGSFLINRAIDGFVRDAIAGHMGAGDLLLDLGCGAQPFRAAVQRHGGRYVGIDRTAPFGPSGTVTADAARLPVVDAGADVVLCTELLEHVADINLVFGEIGRVLRPGGILVLTTPFMYGLHEEPWDFRRLTPHGLAALAADHGLHPLKVRALGTEFDVMSVAWEAYWNRRIPGRGRLAKAALLTLRTAGNLPGLLRRTESRDGTMPAAFLGTGATFLRGSSVSAP